MVAWVGQPPAVMAHDRAIATSAATMLWPVHADIG